MHRRIATEIWRAVKYLLICGAVALPIAQVYRAAVNSLTATAGGQIGLTLTVLSCAYDILNVCINTPLNCYFTFRARKRWYVALPVMLVALLGWKWLTGMLLMQVAERGMTAYKQASTWLGVLWLAVSYLLQRCAVYGRMVDNNRWYTRLHPTNEQGEDTDE